MSDQPLLHVVLHQPEIPQNTGNIGRSCVALRAKLWLVRPLGFRLDETRLRRAGLDYWEHLDWEAVESWDALVERLGERNYWFFTKRGERVHTDARFQRGDALVFGSESQGLPDSLLEPMTDSALKIPIYGPVRSLNLACAVGIGMYEAQRQIGAPTD